MNDEIVNEMPRSVKKLRFAIIGCGKIGQRHAEHIIKRGELSAVCDIDEEKVSRFSTLFHAGPLLAATVFRSAIIRARGCFRN